MSFRLISLIGKFGLTLFITRFLDLSALGVYGLVAAATAIMPAVFGFGLNGSAFRDVVGVPLSKAMPIIVTRLSLTVVVESLFLPLIIYWILRSTNHVSVRAALLIALVILLEHLSTDFHGHLIGRKWILTAACFLCVRTGGWCIAFISAAFFVPRLRTLSSMFLFWGVCLAICWSIFALMLLTRGRLGCVRFNLVWLRAAAKAGWPFYLFDVGSAGSQNLDRLVMSHFLSLDMIGVYTFFLSIANSLSSVIYFGILQPRSPSLIAAAKRHHWASFIQLRRDLLKEAWGWSISFGGLLVVSTPILIYLLHRPELNKNMAILWVVVVATILRTVADALHFVMYALRNDYAMAGISIGAIFTSLVLNIVLLPICGIAGVAIAYISTSGLLLALRNRWSRIESGVDA